MYLHSGPPYLSKRWSTSESAGAILDITLQYIFNLLHGLSREAEHLTSHARFPSPKTGVSQPIRRARSIKKKFVTSKRVPILGKEPPRNGFWDRNRWNRFWTTCTYLWIVYFTRPSLTSVKLDYSTWNIMYGLCFLTFMTASLGTQPWVDRYIRLGMRLNVPQLLPQKIIFSMPVYLAHTRVYSIACACGGVPFRVTNIT